MPVIYFVRLAEVIFKVAVMTVNYKSKDKLFVTAYLNLEGNKTICLND